MAAVRIDASEPGGPGRFSVPSASTPGLQWPVIYQMPGLVYCFCPSFGMHQTCRHTDAVEAAVAAERAAAETPESRAAAKERLAELEALFNR